uniref:Apple domain-containing protein n=1 Tax=Bursaphelenchus xylophilus TaxID=6326 RepID=A0A1I7RIJ0_BURXY
MILLLIFSFLLTYLHAARIDPVATRLANECFTPILRRGVSNAVPIAELWNVSPFDCISYCVLKAVKNGDGCASLVYHKNFKTCQLYNHDGNYENAKVVFATGHDYYNRTSFTGVCADPISPIRSYPQGQARPKARAGATLRVDRPVQVPPKQTKPEKKPDHYFLAATPSTACPVDHITSYILAEGFSLGNNDSARAVINGVDREGCSNYCTQNIVSRT